jgi:hypothetical protein
MALASAAAENAAVNAVTALCADISLHTASPSTTGANEQSGGTYARQTSTFGSASSGTATNTNAPAVPQPASTTSTHFGEWSAATAGTYEIGGALGSSLTTGSSPATVTFAAGSISVGAS